MPPACQGGAKEEKAHLKKKKKPNVDLKFIYLQREP